MSRFNDDGYDECFNNQSELWWANVRRALRGRKGQTALRELESALLELPQKRLISGSLADKTGEVCTVGVIALKRKTDVGVSREEALEQLEQLIQTTCESCFHTETQHGDRDGTCDKCVSDAKVMRADYERRGLAYRPMRQCEEGFKDSGYSNEDGALVTAQTGVSVGLTFVLAWRLGFLNDEDCRGLTPEERYEHVLAWTREQLEPVPSLSS